MSAFLVFYRPFTAFVLCELVCSYVIYYRRAVRVILQTKDFLSPADIIYRHLPEVWNMDLGIYNKHNIIKRDKSEMEILLESLNKTKRRTKPQPVQQTTLFVPAARSGGRCYI